MKYVNLGAIAEFINGYSFKPSDWGDQGLKIIRIQNLTDQDKPFNKTTEIVPERYLVHKGDLLISWSATLGIFEWENDEDALLNQHIFKVVLDSSVVEKKYFMYVLRYTIEKMQQFTHGSTMKHIVRGDFLKHEIPLPSLEEQRGIIKMLDQADSLRQKRKQAIELLDEYVKSVFLDMFGDPVSNPKGWEKKSPSHFGDIITGNTPPRNNKDHYSSNFIEWIKTDNIVFDKAYITTATEYLSETGLKKARLVKPGAILIACIAGSVESIGRAAITDRKVSFNQQINAIQPNDRINSFFLYWLFKMSKSYIQNQATKGMKKILTKGEFEKMLMIIPPLDLQSKFADIFIKTESLKQKMLLQSQELDTQFQALMQKSFSVSN